MANVERALRDALIDAGTRLLEQDGAPGLSARKVAAEARTSTMAVYTHFGGMTGLLDAVADEAFARFARCLAAVPTTDDPVADFLAMGSAYRDYALANRQRYQLMFGMRTHDEADGRTDLTVTGHVTDRPQRADAFNALLHAVRRMIERGRIDVDSDSQIAGRLWAVIHGSVTLEIAGFFGHQGNGLTHVLAPLIIDLLVGMGADRDETTQSMARAAAE